MTTTYSSQRRGTMPGREIGERVAAIEMELRMRGPRHDELERSMDGLTRQMDRVVLLGEQALRDIRGLKSSHDQAIGTLTRGQQRLRTELHAHINKSLVQIVRDRWLELLPIIGSAGVFGYLNHEAAWKIWLSLIGATPG